MTWIEYGHDLLLGNKQNMNVKCEGEIIVNEMQGFKEHSEASCYVICM